ncbi:MAG: hypothetical protein NWE98_03975 [Candidatus Bathyarchaeota archaeon]|nr:hypothetical protein [Candidatus Bathyarchaeota archaeon]
MKIYIYVLFLICTVAFLVRLYPTLISGLPFSTDGWSSIRNAELLLQRSPVSLGNDAVFDGYNNYWPASSLFGAAFSLVTGLSVVDSMAVGVPLAGALTVPLFFVLARKVTADTRIALIATALVATAYPYALFTAGVTKETFANPLYVGLVLIFLLAPSWKRTLLFSVSSAALVLSHHLATIIAIGVLATLTIALFYSKDFKTRYTVKSTLGLLGVISAVAAAYFWFYASTGFTTSVTYSDLVTVGAYQLVVLAGILFFTSKAGFPSRRQMAVGSLVTLGVACSFVLLLTRKSLVSGAPVLPFHYIVYMVPFLVVLPVMMLGFGGLHQRRGRLLLPLFWLSPLIALEGYATFSGYPIGLLLTYRILNFLLLPLLIIAAIGFYKLYIYCKGHRAGRFFGVGVVSALLVVILLNCFCEFASVSMQERYMGYFWLYRAPESAASSWVCANMVNQTVAGDVKVSYLLDGYFGVKVNVFGGLNYLEGNGSAPRLLFVYPEMATNGYVVYSGNVLAVQQNWTSKLGSLNCAYSNGMVNLYAR